MDPTSIVQVDALDEVPGRVVYSKVNKGSNKVHAFVQLAVTANVNIRSETGVSANGDGSGASHTLKINNKEKDRVNATDGFNQWNGIVETTMIFEAGQTYEIMAEAEFHDADPINTDLEVKVLDLR